MKRLKHNRKFISLTLVGIAYALIVTPLVIHNLNQQQDLRGRSQTISAEQNAELSNISTNQTSISLCTTEGTAEVGVAYTNADKNNSANVTATDTSTGQTVDLGAVSPEGTITKTIAAGKASIVGGTVRFTVTPANNPNQPQQVSATYQAKTCQKVTSDSLTQTLTDAPTTCGNVTTDIVLIIDRSGSMGQANKLVQAKNAAKNFIDVVAAQESTTRVSLVSFSTNSTLDVGLTTDYNAIKSKIDNMNASGNTCQECGIAEANKEIATKGRPNVKKVVVMLADGQANWVVGGNGQVSKEQGEAAALASVKSGFNASKTVFFTIGLGTTANSGDGRFFSPEYMRAVAETTGGNFYFPAPDELDGVYQAISQLIGKGLIGGFIFNDANINAKFDTGEQKLSGWTVQAQSGSTSKSAVSNNEGNYTIGGLCEGTYSVKQTMKAGWVQTLPANSAPYSVNIQNASQYNDKHFGNTDKARCSDNLDNDNNGYKDAADSSCHTDGNPKNPNSYDPKQDGEHGGNGTCGDSKDNNGDGTIDGGDPICHTDNNPNNPKSYDPKRPEILTTMDVTVFLHGIGNSGDNTNPTSSSLSNKDPKHPNVGADIQIFTLQNNLIASGTGTVVYQKATGNYRGDIPIQNGFPTGQYTIKVKADTYLRKLVTGVQNITAGNKNSVTAVSLTAGDVNNDNKLDILDYNLLLDCYSDLGPAANCTLGTKKDNTDLNDDGAVNQTDYNLFLREISAQPGQ